MHYTYLIQSKKDNRWYTGCIHPVRNLSYALYQILSKLFRVRIIIYKSYSVSNGASDLRKRFRDHNTNGVSSTKGRGPFKLIYYEACHDKNDAYTREKYLKTGMGKRYLKNRLKRFLTLTGLIMVIGFYAQSADAATISKPPSNLGLVGYWSFNDATSTNTSYPPRATDFSGNNNTGSFPGGTSNPTWVNGKLGKALSFDGSDDVINLQNPSSLTNVNTFTYSAWVYPRSDGQSNNGIIYDKRGNVTGKILLMNATHTFECYINRVTTGADAVAVDNSLTLNIWNFIACTYSSGGSGPTLYVNGKEVGYKAGRTDGSGAISSDSTVSAAIGNRLTGTSLDFSGLIDEVRVYNRALSAAEVAALYKSGAVKFNTSQKSRLQNGLVGMWSFDGSTMGTTSARDSSGQNNTGWLTNGPRKTNGKVGQALSFDGSNDYVDAGDKYDFNRNEARTFSAWINPRTLPSGSDSMGIVSKEDTSGPYPGWSFEISPTTGKLRFAYALSFNTDAYLAQTTNAVISTGKWQHVVAVYNNNTTAFYVDGVSVSVTTVTNAGSSNVDTAIPLNIGNRDNSQTGPSNEDGDFNGLIDEVRIYNRALSVGEVKQLYQQGAAKFNAAQTSKIVNGLVGFWSFDGSAMGTTSARDSSGQNNTGWLVNGPRKTNGKVGQALNFDGSDDYVQVPVDLAGAEGGAITVSAWAKRSSLSTVDRVVAKQRSGFTQWHLTGANNINGDQIPRYSFIVGNGVTTAEAADSGAVPLGSDLQWHHIVGVYDGQTVQIYGDGRPLDSTPPSFTGTLNPSQNHYTCIGTSGATCTESGAFMHGSIDEVRIYNRALTADEIKRLYNMGR